MELGVISVTNEGKDKELITVVGISVDSVCLVEELRKKVGHTDLVSVREVKEKDKDKTEVPCYNYYYPPPCHPCPQQLVAYGTVNDTSPSICSIM